jgi:transposase-like protein
MKIEGRWCANVRCRDFGKVDADNIVIHSHAEQRYRCRTCQQTFSADKGTFFETVRSDRLAVIDVFALLSERNSLRAIERLTHHPHTTLLHWVDLAGQHAAAVSSHLIRNLHVTQVQVDELWTFVKKSRNTWSQTTPPTLAICGSGVPSLCLAACEW